MVYFVEGEEEAVPMVGLVTEGREEGWGEAVKGVEKGVADTAAGAEGKEEGWVVVVMEVG